MPSAASVIRRLDKMFRELLRVSKPASQCVIFLHLLLGSGLICSAVYVPSGSALDYVFSSPVHTLSALAFGNRSIVSEEAFAYLYSATSGRCSPRTHERPPHRAVGLVFPPCVDVPVRGTSHWHHTAAAASRSRPNYDMACFIFTRGKC